MKHSVLLSILFILLMSSVFAQTSNDEVGAKWKSGKYDSYFNEGTTTWDVQKDEKLELICTKQEGKLLSVSIGKYTYTPDNDHKGGFVMFYQHANSKWNLHFTKDKIFIFTGSAGNPTLIGAIGGKPKKSDRTALAEAFEPMIDIQAAEAKALQEEARKTDITQRVADVQSVEIKMVAEKELETGVEFEVGAIVYFNDGTSIKTENLGGKFLKERQVSWGSSGAKWVSGTTYKTGFCDDINDDHVKIAMTVHGKTIGEQRFPVASCYRDPAVVEAEKQAEIKRKEEARLAEIRRKEAEEFERKAAIARAEREKNLSGTQAAWKKRYAANSQKYKSSLPKKKDLQLHYFKELSKVDIDANNSHPLAMTKTSDGIYVLSAYDSQWPSSVTKGEEYHTNFGLILSKHDRNGKFIRFGQPFEQKVGEKHKLSFVKFEATDYGFVGATGQGVVFFDRQMQVLGSLVCPKSWKVGQIEPITGTTKIGIVGVTSVKRLVLNIYDFKTKKYTYDEYGVGLNSPGDLRRPDLNPNTIQLEELKGEALVSIFSNYYAASESSSMIITKHDLPKLLKGEKEGVDQYYNAYRGLSPVQAEISTDGFLRGVCARESGHSVQDLDDLTLFELDPAVSNKDDFEESNRYQTYSEKENPISIPRYAKKVGNHTVVMGRGNRSIGTNVSVAAFYDYDWNLVGYFKLNGPTDAIEFEYEFERLTTKNADYNVSGDEVSANVSSGNDLESIKRRDSWDSNSDAEKKDWTQLATSYSNTFDVIALSDSEYLLLTAGEIRKVSIRSTPMCERKTKIMDVDAYAARIASEEEELARLNAEAAAAEAERNRLNEPNKITILNDLADRYQRNGRNDVVVEINGGTGNSGNRGTRSIPQGSYIRVHCDSEQLYSEGGGFKVPDMSIYCGQTIRLSEVW